MNIGIHTCPGGDCDSTQGGDVDYAGLLPSVDANGVPQVCFIGVINPLDPRVESPQEVADDVLLAAKYIPKERLGSTDDCGFSPFSIDVKPKHGSPDHARDIACEKIEARIEGTKIASDALFGAESP